MNKELKSNTCEVIWLEVNDENLSSSANNFPLGHASSMVLEGSPSANFLDNELNSTGSDLVQGGPWCIPHQGHETRGCNDYGWYKESKMSVNCRRTNSWTYWRHDSRVWQLFGSIRSEVMMTWKRSNWKAKSGWPKPRKVNNEVRIYQPDTKKKSVMFKSDKLLTQLVKIFHFPTLFLAGTPIIFYHKLEGDSICL